MKIKFLRSGLDVQGITGITKESETQNVPNEIANNLIKQGIAEQVKSATKEPKEKTKGGDK